MIAFYGTFREFFLSVMVVTRCAMDSDYEPSSDEESERRSSPSNVLMDTEDIDEALQVSGTHVKPLSRPNTDFRGQSSTESNQVVDISSSVTWEDLVANNTCEGDIICLVTNSGNLLPPVAADSTHIVLAELLPAEPANQKVENENEKDTPIPLVEGASHNPVQSAAFLGRPQESNTKNPHLTACCLLVMEFQVFRENQALL